MSIKMFKNNIYCLLAFFALLAQSPAARAAFGDPFTITAQAIDFGELSSVEVREKVRTILENEGMLAITAVPGLARARKDALVASAKCILKSGRSAAPVTLDLKDASQRSSWGGFVEETGREEVDFTDKCPDLQAKMEKLRDVVDAGSEYFAQLLDWSVLDDKQSNQGLLPRRDGGSYQTFTELVTKAKHLDHFHVYEKSGVSTTEEDFALDFHTDQGLFIGMVPSIMVSSNGEVNLREESFQIQLSNGQIAKVQMPLQGDVLLFMVGDGSNYLNNQVHSSMRPVPHALALKSTLEGEPRKVRAWFGRMFFAPQDAVLNAKGDTFQTMIDTVMEARRLDAEFPSLGCSQSVPSDAGRVLMDMSGGNCTDGEVYCWMSCMSTANLNCSSDEVICQSANTGEPWMPCDTCHDMSARLVCTTTAPTLSPNDNSTGHNLDTPSPTTSGAVKLDLGMTIASFVLAALSMVMLG